ncbi:MAG: transglutaminase domain-containing protein [Acidimicrobiales bacterium]|jgi:transglutaminase-like putative cysteine protease
MSAWLALVLTDVVAVATFARCFTGPGELTAALVTLLLVHLVGLEARGGMSALRVTGLGGTGEPDLAANQSTRRPSRVVPWALGLVVAVFLPIGIVEGPTFLWIVPGYGAWHVMFTDIRAGWTAFSFRLAPVPELPGLVLATAWAAGTAGLLAELISSKRRVPAVLALVPALGLYLFASALGTDSWRVPGLAAMAGSACWYLVAVVGQRERDQGVLVATPDTGLSAGERTTSHRAGAVPLWMAALAAFSAAALGPNLPGARSVALVAWHGTGGAGNGGAKLSPGATASGVQVSTLVQVAQQEVDDPSVALFTVHSRTATREMIAALDEFNGVTWSATAPGSSTEVSSFSPPFGEDERQPPPAVPDGPGHEQLLQIFEVSGLRGHSLPSWGYPITVANAGHVWRYGSGGSIVSATQLQRGSLYAVDSVEADPSPVQLEADTPIVSNREYLQLPRPVPSRLVELANRIVLGATTAYEKALDIDAYLTSPRFRYELPRPTKLGVVAPSSGYGDIVNFLFKSETGYCQQFATSFAVLARIDGLPTRIAVGFLPGIRVGHDEWQVDGSDTHAWPQVQFENFGWIDFEPTPGTSVQGSSAPASATTATTTTRPSATPPTSGTTHNTHRSGNAASTKSRTGSPGFGAYRSARSLAPWLLLLPACLVFWTGALVVWRRLRLQRLRRESRAGVLAAWSDALRNLERVGVRRRRAETYLELASRVSSTGVLSGEAELAFADLAMLATTASYAGTPPGELWARQATRDARTVVRGARGTIARWKRIMSVFDPRNLPRSWGSQLPHAE